MEVCRKWRFAFLGVVTTCCGFTPTNKVMWDYTIPVSTPQMQAYIAIPHASTVCVWSHFTFVKQLFRTPTNPNVFSTLLPGLLDDTVPRSICGSPLCTTLHQMVVNLFNGLLEFPRWSCHLAFDIDGYGLPVLGDSVMPMVKQAIRIFVPIRDAG